MRIQCTGSECKLIITTDKTWPISEDTTICTTLGLTQTIAGSVTTSQYDVNIATLFVGPDMNTIAKLQTRTNITAKPVGYGGKKRYATSA